MQTEAEKILKIAHEYADGAPKELYAHARQPLGSLPGKVKIPLLGLAWSIG